MLSLVYAFPFILLSLVCCLCCLAIPSLRRYTLQAIVAPVAFGFCSILSFVLIVVACNLIEDRFHIPLSPGPIVGINGWAFAGVSYFVPGLLGARLALALTKRLKERSKPIH